MKSSSKSQVSGSVMLEEEVSAALPTSSAASQRQHLHNKSINYQHEHSTSHPRQYDHHVHRNEFGGDENRENYIVKHHPFKEKDAIRQQVQDDPVQNIYGVCHGQNSMMGRDYNIEGSDVELGEPSICAGCEAPILDRYFLVAVDKQWHVACLCCAHCNIPLESQLTCFSKDGNIYCKEDYYRKFAVKTCSRCILPISSQELVMHARDLVFHVTCFACTACNIVLKTGEQFGMRDSLIFCKHHYQEVEFSSADSSGEFPSPPTQSAVIGDMSRDGPCGPGIRPIGTYQFPGVTPPSKGRPRKRKTHQLMLDDHNAFSSALMAEEIGPDGYPLSNSRHKRIRTSFKHHQLRILKSYFALNQNPDAKDLKQLSQKTGLQKRVLQVWFQNARAKYRRNLQRQDSNGNNKDVKDEPSSPRSPSDNTQHSFSSELNDEGSRSPDHIMNTDHMNHESMNNIRGSPSNMLDIHNAVINENHINNNPHHLHPPHEHNNLLSHMTHSLTELYSSAVNNMN